MMKPARPSFRWIAGALLLVGVVMIYRRVPEFEFLAFDDDHNIVFNPHLGPLTWERVQWAWTDWAFARRCMPLGWLGLAAIYGGFGLEAVGWHTVNLGLHLAGTFLLWLILRRLAAGPAGGGPLSVWAEAAAVVGAAFWAWHPLRAESVAWSSGILYGQAHLLFFAAIWCALRAPRGVGWTAGTTLFYAASLLTYPVALGAVPAFVVLARWQGRTWREALRGQVAVAVVAVAVLAANIAAQALLSEAGRFTPAPTLADFPLGARWLQAGVGWLHYLLVSGWPVGLTPVNTLLVDHAPTAGIYWALAAGWWAIVGLTALWPKARRTAGSLLLVYAALLLPMLGLTQRPHFPSDRYGALPQAVLAAGIVLGLLRVHRRRGLALVVAGGGLVGSAVVAENQVGIWRDNDALWSHIATHLGPGLPPSYAEIPRVRALVLAGRLGEARARIDAALGRAPEDRALREVAAQVSAVETETRAVAARLGLKELPPAAALLHHELARDRMGVGDVGAAEAHLREVRRIAPELYTKITAATGPSVR